MKKFKNVVYLAIMVGGIGLLSACGSARDKETKQTQAEIDSLQLEKRKLTEKLQDEKRKIDEEIADLREKRAKTNEKKAIDFYDESINRLDKTNDSLDARMQRFERETEKDWKQLKKEMNEAFDSAERELEEVGKAIGDFFRKDDKKK